VERWRDCPCEAHAAGVRNAVVPGTGRLVREQDRIALLVLEQPVLGLMSVASGLSSEVGVREAVLEDLGPWLLNERPHPPSGEPGPAPAIAFAPPPVDEVRLGELRRWVDQILGAIEPKSTEQPLDRDVVRQVLMLLTEPDDPPDQVRCRDVHLARVFGEGYSGYTKWAAVLLAVRCDDEVTLGVAESTSKIAHPGTCWTALRGWPTLAPPSREKKARAWAMTSGPDRIRVPLEVARAFTRAT
jgi:hypothetical protein